MNIGCCWKHEKLVIYLIAKGRTGAKIEHHLIVVNLVIYLYIYLFSSSK